MAKHHMFFGKDKVIGIAQTSCKSFDQPNQMVTLTLESCLPVTYSRRAILNVLSACTNDKFAREFVDLVTIQRHTNLAKNTSLFDMKMSPLGMLDQEDAEEELFLVPASSAKSNEGTCTTRSYGGEGGWGRLRPPPFRS